MVKTTSRFRWVSDYATNGIGRRFAECRVFRATFSIAIPSEGLQLRRVRRSGDGDHKRLKCSSGGDCSRTRSGILHRGDCLFGAQPMWLNTIAANLLDETL